MTANIKALILDDEPKSRKILSGMLERYCPQVEILGECASGQEAYTQAIDLNPSLVFLDIEMPYENGFEFLERFGTVPFEVIFITAYHNYAVKAIRMSALDYLLKPINISELKTALEKAEQRIADKESGRQYNALMHNISIPQQADRQQLAIPTTYGFECIEVRNIIALEADGGYTRIHCTDNKVSVSTRTLKEYEDLLPENLFFRSHHSFIINLSHIKKYYRGNGGYVQMTNNLSVDISKRRKLDFLKKIGTS